MNQWKLDNTGSLYDPNGTFVGKVDHENVVWNGWRRVGHITNEGKYFNEDKGWEEGWVLQGRPSYSPSSSASGCGWLNLISIPTVYFVSWATRQSKQTQGMIIIVGAFLILATIIPGCCLCLGPFLIDIGSTFFSPAP